MNTSAPPIAWPHSASWLDPGSDEGELAKLIDEPRGQYLAPNSVSR